MQIIMDKNNQEKKEQFLDSKVLRPNLILAALYIADFEGLKCSIVGRLRELYDSGYNEYGLIVQSEYKDIVLSTDKSLTYASLKWLKESQAISDEDIEKYNKAQDCHKLLVYEFPKILMEGLPSDFTERFNDITVLLDKIENWWIDNFDIKWISLYLTRPKR
jgi:hypothetical protein